MNLIAGAILWLAAAVLVTGAGVIDAFRASNREGAAFTAVFLSFCALGCFIVGIKLFLNIRLRRPLDTPDDAPKNQAC